MRNAILGIIPDSVKQCVCVCVCGGGETRDSFTPCPHAQFKNGTVLAEASIAMRQPYLDFTHFAAPSNIMRKKPRT